MYDMPYLLREENILVIHQHSFNCIIELWIANSWTVQAGKQVPDQTQEERNILKYKLGKIHITKSSHQHHILQWSNKNEILELDLKFFFNLIQVRRASLQLPGHH